MLETEKIQQIKNPNFSLFPYIGGKHRLTRTIIDYINNTPHSQFAEVFAGSAKVFFRKKPSQYEVLNDFNNDIANLFVCIKEDFDRFINELKWLLFSKSHFKYILNKSKEKLPNYKKAAYFYYLQKSRFGGGLKSQGWKGSSKYAPVYSGTIAQQELLEAHNRLSKTTIDNLDFEDFINKYDSKDCLFYLDPPYFGTEDYYDAVFTKQDFVRLRQCLDNIKGKFILSINDCPQTREIFKDYKFEEQKVPYSINPKHQQKRGELLIFNYNYKKTQDNLI